MPILSTFGAGSSAGVHPLASGGGGEPAVKNGYYTDGYYVAGTQTIAPTASPQVALDAYGLFYTYSTASLSLGTIAYGYHIHTAGHYYDFGVSGTGTTNPTLMQNTFFSTGTEGSAGYAITTIDSEGVGTTVEMNHIYGGGEIWHDNSSITSSDILYTGRYTNATANNLGYYVGADDTEGYAHITTSGIGVATVSPVDHSYGSGEIRYDNSSITSSDILYTGRYTNATANNLDYYVGAEGYAGYAHITTSGIGVATVSPVDHSYGSGSTWRDNSIPVDGNTIYTGRYTNAPANYASFYIGTEGVSGYAHVTTDAGGTGVATVTPVDHIYGSGSTWRDNSIPVDGNTIYTGRYTNAPANNATFYTGTAGTEGYTRITTSGAGAATVSPVDHSYGSGSRWYDNSSIASDDIVYTGRYTDATANNATFYTGTAGDAGYAHITTGVSGVATVSPVDHSYGSGSRWHDNSSITSSDILYTGRYTNATANNLDYYVGTAGDAGYARVTTSGIGVATVTPVDHIYGGGEIWHDNSSIASSDILYTGRYTDATANSLDYYVGADDTEGYAHITTSGIGVATVTPVNHSYAVTVNNTTYYRDTGSNTLYTGRYTNTLGTPTGLGSNMYYYSASSTPQGGLYSQISVNTLYSSCHNQTQLTEVGLPVSTGLNAGNIVRKADGTIFDLYYFVYSGYRYTVNTTTGAITTWVPCDAYN